MSQNGWLSYFPASFEDIVEVLNLAPILLWSLQDYISVYEKIHKE